MADKPSRALVIYGDGIAPLVTTSHSNLHSFASLACCGFLALRDAPHPSENENEREIRELAQLLDAYDYYSSLKGGNDGKDAEIPSSLQTISERFMGLRAALVTASTGIRSFAKDIGFTVMQIDDLLTKGNTDAEHPKTVDNDLSVATEMLWLLGFSKGRFLEKSEFDLVFFHIRANEMVRVFKDKMVFRTDVDYVDKFVGEIMQMSHSEPEVSSRLYVSILLSSGTVQDHNNSSESLFPDKINSDLLLLRPRQCYTMKGGMPVNDIRHHHPVLQAQLQNSVTRRDLAEQFTFKEIEKNGGNLAILADRFLHEIAFKLWKAPKYGA